jgi:hypothetical protein
MQEGQLKALKLVTTGQCTFLAALLSAFATSGN